MAKLYYTSTSCGAASFISAFTAGISLPAEQVNIQTHKTASGQDYYNINPKGNVPTLILEDGTILNENIAVLQYIADMKPNTIAPENGTIERVRMQNLLAFLATELHPAIAGLFNASVGDETKQFLRNNAAKKLSYLENQVFACHHQPQHQQHQQHQHQHQQKEFLQGGRFTIADSYLYIILSWCRYVNLDLSQYPKTLAYYEFIASLPNIKAAHERITTSPSSTY